MKVFKFGGASVKDANAVKNVANILSLYKDEKLGIVISAMGKTTNAMEKIVEAYWNKDEVEYVFTMPIDYFIENEPETYGIKVRS